MQKSLSLIAEIGHGVHETVATQAMIGIKNMVNVANAGLEGAGVLRASKKRKKGKKSQRVGQESRHGGAQHATA